MRVDRLLFFLRFAKSRALAQAIVRKGHCRLNGERLRRVSTEITPGDVLTLPRGDAVTVIRIQALPPRRGPATEARCYYHELDENGQSALAADDNRRTEGIHRP